MFEKIKKWYIQGLWSADMVQKALLKNIITQEQATEIAKSAKQTRTSD